MTSVDDAVMRATEDRGAALASVDALVQEEPATAPSSSSRVESCDVHPVKTTAETAEDLTQQQGKADTEEKQQQETLQLSEDDTPME